MQRTMYREEAWRAREQSAQVGRIVRVDPVWADATYRVLLACVLACAVFISVGKLDEYATGPAVIRIEGRIELTAPVTGTIEGVIAQPGERVERGQPLLRYHSSSERAELARLDREHDALVLRLLRDPGDTEASAALAMLAGELELALTRLAQRTVLAPADGVVADVRVRPGQAVSPGDALLTLTGERAKGKLVALLPAQFRPVLHPGQVLYLELAGFRFHRAALQVASVSEAAVGPNEARRYLGPERADAVALRGPVVVVQAELPSLTFDVGGEALSYHDGMIGAADARVRTQSILLSLIPGLRDLLGRST